MPMVVLITFFCPFLLLTILFGLELLTGTALVVKFTLLAQQIL